MKTVIMTDVHGCVLEMRGLLRLTGFRRSEDTLLLLGDLFDRGGHSYEVYQAVRQLKEEMGSRLVLVRGNHDQFLLDYLENGSNSLWIYNGGFRTINSFMMHEEPLSSAGELLRDSRYYYETDQFIAVHAGLKSEIPEENDIETFLWDREILNGHYSGKLGIGGHTPLNEPVYFMPGGEALTLPYDTALSLPESGFICLDTGCVFGNKLTAMVIADDKYRLYGISHKDY